MNTPEQLAEYLDVHMAAVIDKATSLTSDWDPVIRAGSIAGFMVKTAIAMAARGGAPRRTLELAIKVTLDEMYAPGAVDKLYEKGRALNKEKG